MDARSRGQVQAFASGPAINEVLVSGRFQVGSGGNFPFTSLLDKQGAGQGDRDRKPEPAARARRAARLAHQVVQGPEGRNPPATIGLVTGSSAEFYVQMAAMVNGVQIGKDVILKNMPPGEQMAMPDGLAGVVPWDPTVAMITQQRKNGRVTDSIFPYNMYEGQFYVRDELVQNVPDVVQALTDALRRGDALDPALSREDGRPDGRRAPVEELLEADPARSGEELQQHVQAELHLSECPLLGAGELGGVSLAA